MKNLCTLLLATLAISLAACNGGGSSGGGANPTPSPSPVPTGIGPLQVEVVQQTSDLGTVNWIDLRKVGSTTYFKLKFTNTNSVPVGFYGNLGAAGESHESIFFNSADGGSSYDNLYFTNNLSTESDNCAYYQLLDGYITTESEIHGGKPYNKKIYNWQNVSSMLQPGQSCYYNVYGYSFLNNTDSDTFNINLNYTLHNNNYDTSSWYVSDYTKYFESNTIYMKIVKLVTVNDSITKDVFYDSPPTISLDGKFAVTSSASGSNVTVTRYNVSYDDINGLKYTSPVTFVVPNCNYTGSGGPASLSPTGDFAFVSCSYSDPQWVQIWKINSNTTAQYESYLNYNGAYWISGFDYNVYATPILSASPIYIFDNINYQFSPSGLTNSTNFWTTEVNTDGSFIQVNSNNNWQCLSKNYGSTPLSGLGDNFNIYNSQSAGSLTILDSARLNIKLQYPTIPIKQYSDGTVAKFQPNMTGLAKVNTSNGNCYIESSNFINSTTYGATSNQFNTYYITNDYVAIPYYDSTGNDAIMVTSINNLAK